MKSLSMHAEYFYTLHCDILKNLRLEKFDLTYKVYMMTYQTCTYSMYLMCLIIQLYIIFGNLMYEARIQIDFFPQLLEL